MWDSSACRPPFDMLDIDLAHSVGPVRLGEHSQGAHMLLRCRGRLVGRLWILRARHGPTVSVDQLNMLVAPWIPKALAIELGREISPPTHRPFSLTLAVCTRDRPNLLTRCLASLVKLRDLAGKTRSPDLLVVDNAPSDARTREAVSMYPGVRYAVERVPGLDFGRNRALAETESDWLGFIDDDAVVDFGWLRALAEGIAETSAAGGFAGPILPLMLETEAQLRFERAGGFGKGLEYRRFGSERFGLRTYPMSQGDFGTGASMVFSTSLLRSLGGFDEALDTGPPLPGGGDSDMYYRVIRSGHPVVYLPGLAVHHEHRRDMKGLASQYYSWGKTVFALAAKTKRDDPSMHKRHQSQLRYYVQRKVWSLVRALALRGPSTPSLVLAELFGMFHGSTGEYARSEARVAARKLELRE